MKRNIQTNLAATDNGRKSALQDIVLESLYEQGFFELAALSGYTAANVAYGSPFFSDHLEFCLLEPDSRFELMPFMARLEHDLAGYGTDIEISVRKKMVTASRDSMECWSPHIFAHLAFRELHKLTISMSIETGRSPFFALLDPCRDRSARFNCIPLPALFARIVHALLLMPSKERGSVRDWFHVEWCVANKVELPLDCLLNGLLQSGKPLDPWTAELVIRHLLLERISELDFNALINDLFRSGTAVDRAKIWTPEYFRKLVREMTISAPWH